MVGAYFVRNCYNHYDMNLRVRIYSFLAVFLGHAEVLICSENSAGYGLFPTEGMSSGCFATTPYVHAASTYPLRHNGAEHETVECLWAQGSADVRSIVQPPYHAQVDGSSVDGQGAFARVPPPYPEEASPYCDSLAYQTCEPCVPAGVLGKDARTPGLFLSVGGARDALLQEWSRRYEEWLPSKDIFAILNMARMKYKGFGVVLDLVLDGVPIEYDKNRERVRLLRGRKGIIVPEEGETLLTLMYDLLVRYKKDITRWECAYYAHESGYWQRGFYWHQGCKALFYSYLEKCKKLLVVLGFVKKDVFAESMRNAMELQANLWKKVYQYRFVHAAHVYGPRVTNEDTNFLRYLLKFTEEDEYKLLNKHVARRPLQPPDCTATKTFIRNHVKAQSYSKNALISLCRRQQIDTARNFWPAVHSLVSEAGPGRMVYDLAQDVFLWSQDGCPPARKEAYLVRALYYTDRFGMTTNLMVAILQQEGFSQASAHDVQIIARCFVLLGVDKNSQEAEADVHAEDDVVKAQRTLINFMLENKTFALKGSPDSVKDADLSDWAIRICRRTVILAKNRQVLGLLLSLGMLKADPSAAPPPMKRPRVEEQNSEKVIREHMPALYTLVFQQKCNPNLDCQDFKSFEDEVSTLFNHKFVGPMLNF